MQPIHGVSCLFVLHPCSRGGDRTEASQVHETASRAMLCVCVNRKLSFTGAQHRSIEMGCRTFACQGRLALFLETTALTPIFRGRLTAKSHLLPGSPAVAALTV